MNVTEDRREVSGDTNWGQVAGDGSARLGLRVRGPGTRETGVPRRGNAKVVPVDPQLTGPVGPTANDRRDGSRPSGRP